MFYIEKEINQITQKNKNKKHKKKSFYINTPQQNYLLHITTSFRIFKFKTDLKTIKRMAKQKHIGFKKAVF